MNKMSLGEDIEEEIRQITVWRLTGMAITDK